MTTEQQDLPETRPRKDSPYTIWKAAEGIPIHAGSYIDSLYTVEVAPWPRIGQSGAIINLASQEHDDGWVIEIAPGGQTNVMHHMFEATFYVLSGRGATMFWQDGQPKDQVEWQGGSIFSPPLNCNYQHFNGDGQAPVRLFAVTNAPMVMNLYRDGEFPFRDTFTFDTRYESGSGFFDSADQKISRNTWVTNFIADIRKFGLDDAPNRGASGQLTMFAMSNNSMAAHCSEFPSGTYKKSHLHNVGAHVIILSGKGYSLLWFEGETERRRVDWQDGSVLSPREREYHQHFNSGPTPARYLALRLGELDARHYLGFMPEQIEYEQEDPAIYEEYSAECVKNGATVVLPRPAYAPLAV
jgi:mannose-6-phosphate isomerase-like protein (cupin superfamily)